MPFCADIERINIVQGATNLDLLARRFMVTSLDEC